ncbi:uncharacterized protein SCODWIG_03004 [Saccharomycodes ludwigii]|uniref:Inositol-pentakisphosphate 2-kinase n=1 Tax=Saccharomycodes ludwigii TaxID=36035 RepID=A0A376B979_9ASCO|nr:uncharacterized protein SCODWIG_03004 [Saccharomycodes ludwigii]
MGLQYFTQGNANVLFETDSQSLLRISKRFSRLSENNTYTATVNTQFIKSIINKNSTANLPFILYELVKIKPQYNPNSDYERITLYLANLGILIDSDEIIGFKIPNLFYIDKTITSINEYKTIEVDHYTKIHVSLRSILWECKPKWEYFQNKLSVNNTDYTTYFCRNCTNNIIKNIKTQICYCNVVEFDNTHNMTTNNSNNNNTTEKITFLKKILLKYNLPSDYLSDITSYLILNDNNVIRLVYKEQTNLLAALPFFDPHLMTLRDVSCFIIWKRAYNGDKNIIESRIVDVDYKPYKKSWETQYSKIIEYCSKKIIHKDSFQHEF